MQVLAANGLLEKVSVINKDAGLLERGQDLQHAGVNIIVADFFDAGKHLVAICVSNRRLAFSINMGGRHRASRTRHERAANTGTWAALLMCA